jgi:RimJ/RimL family protein N-acetyltransferase
MTDPVVQIRRSTVEDFDGFYDCFAAICRERQYLALVEPPPRPAAREFIEDALRRGMVQYVASVDGRIIGWCDIVPHAWEGFRHSGRLGMGIDPQFRGKGIGRRLMDATIDDARAQGLTRIELEVFSSNTNAIKLYERRGFVHEGLHRRGRIIDGRVEDVLMMGLVFDE